MLKEISARNGNYAELAPPLGKAARHLRNGTKLEVALMMTARAGACKFRGNKTAKKGATAEERACTQCFNPNLIPEDETHVFPECRRYMVPRSRLDRALRRCWSTDQLQSITRDKEAPSTRPAVRRTSSLPERGHGQRHGSESLPATCERDTEGAWLRGHEERVLPHFGGLYRRGPGGAGRGQTRVESSGGD